MIGFTNIESSSGHVIENAAGTALTERDNLQFAGYMTTTDDSTNNRTVVSDEPTQIDWEDWLQLSAQEKVGTKWIIVNAPGHLDSDQAIFTLKDEELTFTNLVATVSDTRINENTYPLIYWADDSYDAASAAGITSETSTGTITFTATTAPSTTLTCDIVFISNSFMSEGGAGGGHIIVDPSGTDLPQEDRLKFVGNNVSVTDDDTNGQTVVSIQGAHVIQDASGTAVAQEPKMQFTDSHVSDDSTNDKTKVEVIKSVASADYSSETEDGLYLIPDGDGSVIEPASEDYVEVTADGVKTYGTLFSELYAKIDMNKITPYAVLQVDILFYNIVRKPPNLRFGLVNSGSGSGATQMAIQLKSSSSECVYVQVTSQTSGNTVVNKIDEIATSGIKLTLYYGNKKAVVDLQTTANRCLMSDGVTSVEDALKKIGYIDVNISGVTITNADSGWYYNMVPISGLPTGATCFGVALGNFDANVSIDVNKIGALVFRCPVSKTLPSNRSVRVFYYT